MFTKTIGNKKSKTRLIWLHGWGVDHKVMLPIANYFNDFENVLIDLPGFGKSDTPEFAWGSDDYGRYINEWLKSQPKKKNYIIGYSFGAKVALHISNLNTDSVNGLIFISGAGLKDKRSIIFKTKLFIIIFLGKCLQIFDNIFHTKLRGIYSSRFGSEDRRGLDKIKKDIFLKVIKENLASIASKIDTPVLLIYGSEDTKTSTYIGKCYNKLIKNSQYIELKNFDHYTILSQGLSQVEHFISSFLNNIK